MGAPAGEAAAVREPFPRPLFPPATHQLAGDVAGFTLALLLWGWVIMPLLTGGPSQVKKVLLAKFVNKAPDGTWLP